jgi:hypothetical protein
MIARGRVVVPLAVGFGLASTTFFGLVWLLGHGVSHEAAWYALLPIALSICALSDLLFPRFRLPTPRRQTPQGLVGRFHPTLGGFVWGIDTGSVVTTIRASAASWAGVILIAGGWGPWWSGLVYAAAFCLPLIAIVLAVHRNASSDMGLAGSRAQSPLALLDGVHVTTNMLTFAPRVRIVSGIALAAVAGLTLIEAIPR